MVFPKFYYNLYFLDNYLKKEFIFLKDDRWSAYFNAEKYTIPHFKKRQKGGEDYSIKSEKLVLYQKK